MRKRISMFITVAFLTSFSMAFAGEPIAPMLEYSKEYLDQAHKQGVSIADMQKYRVEEQKQAPRKALACPSTLALKLSHTGLR